MRINIQPREKADDMNYKRILVIANPASQHGQGLSIATDAYTHILSRFPTSEVEFVLTQRAGHAIELVGSAPSVAGIDLIIAIGGDGLVHEIVNGLMKIDKDDRPVFALIPAGSGNDFATTLGISHKPHEAINQLFSSKEKAIDIGCCNGEYFSETISFGLDAAIAMESVERRERTGQKGTALYLACGINQLFHHLNSYQFLAILDGEREIAGTMLMFAIQNGATYGGGFKICPDADPSDGLLNICYAESPMSIPEATFKFLRAKSGKHVKFSKIHFERAARIELSFNINPVCQIDGESYEADVFSVSLNEKALKVLSVL